jgi:HSP20 family protein
VLFTTIPKGVLVTSERLSFELEFWTIPAKGEGLTQEAASTLMWPLLGFVSNWHNISCNKKKSAMSSLIRRPWESSLLSDFFAPEDRFFNGQSNVAVNVKEHDKNYEVEVAAPGFEKKDFNIEVNNGVLTISGEKKTENKKEDGKYTHREFGYTSFSRSFNLPANTTESDVQAKYDGGILKLSIAKKEESNKARKSIDIT